MNLEYLNLELYQKDRNIIKRDEFKHKCYFNKFYPHELHSKKLQLNSIIDMIISLGESLESYHKRYSQSVMQVAQSIGDKNKIIREIKENQQYIKNQLESLHVKLKELEYIKKLRKHNKEMAESHNKLVIENVDKRAKELEQSYKDIKEMLIELKRIALT